MGFFRVHFCLFHWDVCVVCVCVCVCVCVGVGVSVSVCVYCSTVEQTSSCWTFLE